MTRLALLMRTTTHLQWTAVLLFATTAVHAAEPVMQDRDPTLPPPALQAAARNAEPGAAPATADVTPRHVMTIDGRRYLIEGGRRHAVGDLLGAARIERIDDGSVWLREGGALRQVSLYGGIVKRTLPDADVAPATTASGSTAASPNARRAPRAEPRAKAVALSPASPNPPNR